MLSGDEEVGRYRHGLPRHHECVGVIGQEHQPHAGQKQVVLQAHQSRCRSLAAAEVARRKDGNAGRCGTRAARERSSRAHRAARASADPVDRPGGRPAQGTCLSSTRLPPQAPGRRARRGEKASDRRSPGSSDAIDLRPQSAPKALGAQGRREAMSRCTASHRVLL